MSHKKKGNIAQLHKIEAAHQRNEFMLRFKKFCDQVDPTVFPLIPSKHLDEIYLLRNRPVRLDAAPGHNISPIILKEAKGLLFLLKNKMTPFKIGTIEEISLYDFFTIGLTLIMYVGRIKESDYSNALIVKSKLSTVLAFGDSEDYHKAWMEYYGIMSLIGIVMSHLSNGLYMLRHENREQVNGNFGMYCCMDMYAFKTETIRVMIEGIPRPTFRLGIPDGQNFSKFEFSSVKPELVALPVGESLPVFVQSHALDRLKERMDGVTPGFLHFMMYQSFKDPKVCKNKKGEWLFEFALIGKKTGYFKADVIDGKIILRTFLFLTNNGTPEGEKLHEHTGIMKEDKMYLAIDKFSGFMNSDIASNERVKAIFINAGCDSLFSIDPAVFVASGAEQSLAALVENYLGTL